MQTFKYLCATLAIASLATFGCSKEEKKTEGGAAAGGEQGAAKPGTPAAAPSAGGKSAFALFPKETNMVVGINLGQISASQLYKQFIEPKIKAEADKEFAEFKAECGFDPMTTIKSIVIGGVMDNNMEPDEDKMLMVIKGVTRDQAVSCAEKMAKKEDSEVEITQEGNFTKVVNKEKGKTMWVAWLDDSTMALSGEEDKAYLEKRISGADGVDQNKDLMDLLGNTDQSAGIWLAVQKPEGAESPGGVEFKGAFASVNLSGGLKVDAGIRQGSPDEAKQTVGQATQMLEQAKAQAGPFGKYLSKIEISANNADVIAKVSMSDAELQEIIQQLGPMLGGMMGGM